MQVNFDFDEMVATYDTRRKHLAAKMENIVRIVTNPRRGRAIVYAGVLYLGGQTAHDKAQDIKGQMRQVLEKIDRILATAGVNKTSLLTAQIWLKDIGRDFAGMNEVWDAWVDPEGMPTRATAQCQMASVETLVEIIVTAAAPR